MRRRSPRHKDAYVNFEARNRDQEQNADFVLGRLVLQQDAPKLHVTANDLSGVQIDMARGNLSEFEKEGRLALSEGDMMDLRFADATFDAVVAFYSIIHLPRTEQTELMKRIGQWLKPGGLFLANFSEEEIESAVNPKWLDEEKGWVYWSGWGEKGSVRMVEEAGLDVLVKEITVDVVDANFLWVIGKKK
jgi:SAM-dependent methyltransferase